MTSPAGTTVSLVDLVKEAARADVRRFSFVVGR
jgi:hypothetical protein